MGVELVLSLLGGLALFMYGMQMMSTNLEAVAGNRMKQILERLTANRFLGVLVGAGITALIQSSSATTVMTVGFVRPPPRERRAFPLWNPSWRRQTRRSSSRTGW